VRAAEYGVVFPFPADPQSVLKLIDDIAAGRVATHAPGATPERFFPTPETLARTAEVLAIAAPEPLVAQVTVVEAELEEAVVAKPSSRRSGKG
jgi:hypothetical protein